ncbi:hypothetical protein VTJ49DRAFT_298 [Mycothermus thermophilus]|uniref:Uncharacterized protein n=1 Tax=Humicola insolens TaxID=85995 RepID=A0ABR3VGK5_HUMIN
MSVFSVIKRGRQAAKEHKEEQAKKQREENQKPPYKHIPKHAAIDALSGGPAGWRENDRRRIVEQNRRRSAMGSNNAGSTAHLGQFPPSFHPATLPRVHSSLSHVSYPTAYADPVVRLPRNYSLGSMPPGWNRDTIINYSATLDATGLSASSSIKGKEVERMLMDRSYRTSRSSSRVSASRVPLPPATWAYSSPSSSASSSAAIASVVNFSEVPSPAESSSTSTSSDSQEDLQMKPMVRHNVTDNTTTAARTPSHRHSPSSASDRDGAESLHRLHPSRSRRASDAASLSRSISLAPPTGTSTSVPPVPTLPPTEVGAAITTSEPAPIIGLAVSEGLDAEEEENRQEGEKAEAEGSDETEFATAESSNDADEDSEATVVVPATPAPAPTTVVPAALATASSSAKSTSGPKRASKVTRFSDLEPIQSHGTTVVTVTANPPSPKGKSKSKDKKRNTVTTTTSLPIDFDESALPPPRTLELPSPGAAAAAPPVKSGKLTKSASPQVAGGKLVKKNRWSLFGRNTAVAV